MRKLYLMILCLILSSCSVQPRTSYYILPGSHYIPTQDFTNPVLVEVKLSDYLTGPSIAYGVSANSIHLSKNHLWADDVVLSVQKLISNELNQQDKTRHYFIENILGQDIPILSISIEELQGNENGEVSVHAHVKYLSKDNVLIKSRSFSVKIKQIEEGYGCLVDAMSKGLTELAKEISIYLGQ